MMGKGKPNGGGRGSSFSIQLALVKQKGRLNSSSSRCPERAEWRDRTGPGAAHVGSGQPVWRPR